MYAYVCMLLGVSMCKCVSVSIRVCVSVSMCVCARVFVCIHLRVFVCIQVRACFCIFPYMCVYVYVCISEYVSVRMYVSGYVSGQSGDKEGISQVAGAQILKKKSRYMCEITRFIRYPLNRWEENNRII